MSLSELQGPKYIKYIKYIKTNKNARAHARGVSVLVCLFCFIFSFFFNTKSSKNADFANWTDEGRKNELAEKRRKQRNFI